MSGFGARTLVPVGAAAPAPAAEIAKHASAANGAATSARTPRTLFMYALLDATAVAAPLGAAPVRPCQLRRDDHSDVSEAQTDSPLPMPEVVGAREGGVDVGAVGERA